MALRLGSQQIVAKATVRLTPGQLLTATVGKSGATTVLRIDPPTIQQTFFSQAGVPQDAGTEALFRAMVRAGVPLDPSFLRRLRSSLGPEHRPSDQTARLLVEAHRKGLALPYRAVEGFGDLSQETGSESDGRGAFEERRKQQQRDAGNRGSERSATPETVSGAARQLFNHIGTRGDTGGDHWIVVPLVFDDRTHWKGSARIRFDATGRWREAAIRFDTGDNSHWALVSSAGGSVTLFPRGNALRGQEDRLRAALENLGFGALSFAGLPADFDGFSTKYSPDIIRPVDEEA